jgi:hypothetical protein
MGDEVEETGAADVAAGNTPVLDQLTQHEATGRFAPFFHDLNHRIAATGFRAGLQKRRNAYFSVELLPTCSRGGSLGARCRVSGLLLCLL